MADLTQKYDLYNMPELELQLKRFYVGDSADSVGSITFWRDAIWDLYNQMPFRPLWKGMQIEIWDMDSPDLLSSANPDLQDYDLHTPGNQTAVGLYFGGDGKRIAMGVFANTPEGLAFTRDALSHEVGHLYGDIIDFETGASIIEREITRLVKANWYNQAGNTSENFAEHYRALLGGSTVIGTFSDRKPIPANDKLKTIFKTAYWLRESLRSKNNISNVELYGTYVQWAEKSFLGLTTTYYAVTSNWEKFIWQNNKWSRI